MIQIKSQLADQHKARVIAKAGGITLEISASGNFVISDGFLADWIVFYPGPNPDWAYDGSISIPQKLRDILDAVAATKGEV